MTVQCIDCKHAKLQGAPMIRQGMSGCRHHPAWIGFGLVYQRTCREFSLADADDIAKRRAWNEAKN